MILITTINDIWPITWVLIGLIIIAPIILIIELLIILFIHIKDLIIEKNKKRKELLNNG
ncbi:hypothetical protein [Spiroplasma endosymbiont of Aleiodes alternator]|uniref:hypothetical protein n=1 Tax=Spiroplasma endosymbiont of Aleiodes alternator TaxID=3139329 RepID=UPI003CCB4063